MTGAERIRVALEHKEADRVPYDLAGTTVSSISDIAFAHIMQYRGWSEWYDPQEVVDTVSQIIIPPEEILQRLEVDVRRIGAPRVFDYQQRLRIENGDRFFTDNYGCDWEMLGGKDFYFNQTRHPLEEYEYLEDCLSEAEIPDLEFRRAELYALFDSQVIKSKDMAFVADRNCAGLTEMFLRLRGYENGYMDLAADPEAAQELLEAFTEHKMQYWGIVADYIAERGLEDAVQIVAECDDLGTQQSTLVSPAMLREMVFPLMQRYMSFIKERMPWVKIFFHSCGAIKPLIPDLIECGVDILNPLQYTATGMDLEEIKREFGEELTFWGGGVDTQNILSRGAPGEVRDEVKRTLDILAPGGGYVFVPVHNIQQDVPAENYWAMWETWKEYGKY